MLNELIEKSWMSEDDILSQIQNEYDLGYTLAEPIREEFDRETKLFNYQKKIKDKIWDSTLFNVHSAMMAREYIDRPTSKFEGNVGQQMLIDNLNTTLDIDFNDSYLENMIYDWKHDKFLRWLGIVVRNGWDWELKVNTFDLIDPRLAILDPDWNYRTWDYSFFWFNKIEYRKNLENGDFENIDSIARHGSGGEAKDLRQKDQENANLESSQSINKENPWIETYYHFAYFNWVRAMVVVANIRTEIINVKIYKEDKKVKAFDDILAITYRRPRKNTPFGDRMPRYVWDVQVAKSMLANLRFDKAKAELYPMYLRNTRLIKNKADLDFWFNKVVDVNPLEWESLSNAVTPLQRDVSANNSYVLDDSLDKQVEASTSIGKIAQWTSPERREAATTNELIQDNTDINLAFTAKIDAIWYERLIKVRYAGYMENFEAGDKKIIYMQTWFGSIPREIKRKDFLTDVALKIKIETVVEIREKNQTDSIAYWQLIWYLQTIPNRPISSQLNTLRNFARSMNMSDDKIYNELPATAQELIAQSNIWLLLAWEMVKVKQDYDPDTHLAMIQSAGNWDNVEAYKYQLIKLKKIMWGQTQEQPQQNESVSNNLAAMATTNAMQQANTQ